VVKGEFLSLFSALRNCYQRILYGWWGGWRGCTEREGNICSPVVRYNRRQETVAPRYSMLLEIMEQCDECFGIYQYITVQLVYVKLRVLVRFNPLKSEIEQNNM
jgi:hypothetical protein